MSSEWENATAEPPVNGTGKAGRQGRNSALRTPNSALKKDRLPPHSTEAEQGVLGCVILDPMIGVPKARKRFQDPEGREFYDLRHREIWLTLGRMYDDRLAGKPLCSQQAQGDGIDLITIQQRLKDHQKLDEVGGLAYLAELPEKTPSAANLDYYVEIVAEKFAARETLAALTTTALSIYNWQGQVEHLVHQLQDKLALVARLATPPEAAERMYLKPGEFGQEHWDRWFGDKKGVPGLPLPEGAFGPEFPFLIREAEFTLLFGEKGMGKSTMASYITLHLLQHWKGVYDSREVHRVETLKKFCNQLMGVKELEHTEENERRLADAVLWLHSRLLINRTTGIKHWRDIIDVWAGLADEGYKFFVLDNLMRIGIREDDFDGQREAVTAMSTFAVDRNVHVILINHSNKGNEGDYRQRSAGHHSIVDNCHNVVEVTRNAKKWEKLWPWIDRLKDKTITHEEFEAEKDVRDWKDKWDAKFYVHAQRLDGTRQNAARELWFMFGVGQYFDHRHPMPQQGKNWLANWANRSGAETKTGNQDVAENWPASAELRRGEPSTPVQEVAELSPGETVQTSEPGERPANEGDEP